MNKAKDYENYIKCIEKKIKDKDDLELLQNMVKYCSSTKDFEQILVTYRHLLADVNGYQLCEPRFNLKSERPISIGYLLNEDHIVYSDLDTKICNYFNFKGVSIIPFKAQDFFYKANKDGIEIYINNELCKFDGFFSYGYRKKSSFEAYMYIAKIMQETNIICLHESNNDLILNNKFLQSIHFAKSNLPIPDTYQTFDVKSTISLCDKFEITPCLAKPLSDYTGDGIVKLTNKGGIINTVGKSIWKGENILLQKFIPDSIGRSVRVLCFNNKAFTIVEYNSNCGDIRSNIYEDTFITSSFMNHEKSDLFKQIAENACNSIGLLTIAGVDLLDSKTDGIVVLEINSWPEIFFSWAYTGINTLNKLTEVFIEKVENSLINIQE